MSQYRLIHAYHEPPFVGDDSARRNAVARLTWDGAHLFGNIYRLPITLEQLDRTFQDDDRLMVFVKDIIDAGARSCVERNDLIMLSNADTCFTPRLYEKIVKEFEAGVQAISGPRRDFEFLDQPLTEEQIGTGYEYIGTDIFVMRPEWWKAHRGAFPDMILGAEMWDHLLRGMMRLENLPEVSNLVYHEFHDSRWTLEHNRHTLRSQRHCRHLGHQWLNSLSPAQRTIVNAENQITANRHRQFTTERANRRRG